MFRQLSIALLATLVSVPLSTAQMRGAFGRPVSGTHAGFARGVTGRIDRRHGRRSFTGSGLVGSPFLYSDYDGSEPYLLAGNAEGDVEDARPQVVLLQPSSTDNSSRRTKPGPLLIEWQGDRYVRFGGEAATDRPGTSTPPDYAERTIAKGLAKPALSATRKEPAPAAELPPAVLVYRDGRREEIGDYTIADGAIFVHATDWQNGYWTKHIPLSALDQQATVRANQQRGVKFLLPSAPNVVIASF
jgi:hypothetical protein